jgi:hypothetical protein
MRHVFFYFILLGGLPLFSAGSPDLPAPVVAEPAGAPQAAVPRAVPTFHSVGLHWKPGQGGPSVPCEVSYREVRGDGVWREALPLWFDANEHPGLPERSQEYRGSLVNLSPDTEYEIKLVLAGTGHETVLKTRTWNEQFKIARVVTLPESLDTTCEITEGGNDRDGYVLYTSPSGKRTVSDVRGEVRVNLRVLASHVIVRGLDLKGARVHGIELGRVENVVIEDCDISGWGENLADGWGRDLDAAIYHETPDGEPRTLKRIVIQHNRLHHPRSNANSWLQVRADRNGSKHPLGPQGISFINGDGEIVIRYNQIYSDFDHMFNDGMGEHRNFTYAGFPGRDSDIYGNFISHCWDDGIEMEGANLNVRCWGNVIDWTFLAIGGAPTALGPSYIFRNVYLHSRRGPERDEGSYRGQSFLKLGSGPKLKDFARGRMYVFHNTTLQPAAWGGHEETSGATRGLHLTAKDKHQTNILSRNNVFWLRNERGTVAYDPQRYASNDFDFDLSNGVADAVEGSERNGIRAIPRFGGPLQAGLSWSVVLEAGTPGHDQAVRIPNFNDDYSGQGPDMGALEAAQALPFYFPRTSGLGQQP